jgi:hypothetical protein
MAPKVAAIVVGCPCCDALNSIGESIEPMPDYGGGLVAVFRCVHCSYEEVISFG